MKSISCLLSAALLVSVTGQSWAAATITASPTGVSSVTAAGKVKVAVGDSVDGRIVVARGAGETVLTYEDGCIIRLSPGQVYTVLGGSPCNFKAQTRTVQDPDALPDQGTSTGDGGFIGGSGMGFGTAAIGGVAVAGIIAGGVIAATSGKKSSNPVYISP